MRKDFYGILFLALAGFAYAGFCTMSMLFHNKVPAYLACEGIALDSTRVYTIGGSNLSTGDTLALSNEQAAMLLPGRLCMISYNANAGHFELRNADDIGQAGNPFSFLCRTMHDGFLQRGTYFGPGSVIPEALLLDRGLKYNLSYGNRATRTALQFSNFKGRLILQSKHEGMGALYPLRSGENSAGILVNAADTVQQRLVFAFTSPGASPATFLVHINAHFNHISYEVQDSQGNKVISGDENTPRFLVDGYLFSVRAKYGMAFAARFLSYGLLLAFFQVFFLVRLLRASSPVIRSLLAFRLLLNIITCLASPLFLSSYFMTPYREWYLALVLLVNFSFWLPKDLFTWRGFNAKPVYGLLIVVIAAMPVLIRLFTYNESLFGVIPVLHCAKLAILLLFYLMEIPWFHRSGRHYLLRIAMILSYALLLSLLSSDTGTFIYTTMAVVVVELIKATLRLRVLIAGAMLAVVFCVLLYLIKPGITSDRKIYRIYAPYTDPSSDRLASANEADRESYTTFLLDLKIIQRLEAPQFNELVVPANMRSTMHTDFAFHWSMMFGGLILIVLYLAATFMLVRHLCFLLFCAARECRISGEICFAFPKSRIAEPVRILLAFTLVSFVFPVLSNLLLIPVTGQSIPMLSISIIEPAFLIFLLAALENIFNNQAYYVVKPQVSYTYRQLLAGFRWNFLLVSLGFVIFLAVKCWMIWALPETYTWKKLSKESNTASLPVTNEKNTLIRFGTKVLDSAGGAAKLSVPQKELLINLAARFRTGKPYFQLADNGRMFTNNRQSLLRSMTADSSGMERLRRISGAAEPFGRVYSFVQRVNEKPVRKVSNSLYSTIPPSASTVNGDLTAELNNALAQHLALTGAPSNIGAVMVVDNRNGQILANSLYPLQAGKDANEVYYFIGSLKKLLVAYCALEIDSNYRHIAYAGKSFDQFIRYSDDRYAAYLLKDLLQHHREALNNVLTTDFSLPLQSATADAYLDVLPLADEYRRKLDRKNSIYRLAIGQQRPYPLSEVIQWYSRVASGRRLVINYGDSISCQPMMMDTARLKLFRRIFNSVLSGTAVKVGAALSNGEIDTRNFFCKTGTAESSSQAFNASSSFIIADPDYTIAIMLNGRIPHNDEGLAAKDLFIKIQPLLLKYHILTTGHIAR